MTLAELLQEYFNLNQLASEIVSSVVIFFLAFIIGWLVYSIFARYLSGWAKRTKSKLDDEILKNIKAPVVLLALLFGAFYGLENLTFLDPYSGLITSIFIVAEILVVTFIVNRVISILISWYATRAKRQKRLSEHLLYILKRTIQFIIYLFAFLAILAAFKMDLSGVIVGLGVGGIAIALALQNILSDIFSAFSIYFDRPFEIGDFIVVGDYSGTVKKIGVRSTRIELLQGEELIISNRQLITTSVRNFRKLKKRRVVFNLGVSCDTSTEKLRRVPELIKKIINESELAEFNRTHFTKFGDYSLDFEVVYYMKTSDYVKYLDTQHTINLAIKEAFEREDIELAYPTQTIFVNK